MLNIYLRPALLKGAKFRVGLITNKTADCRFTSSRGDLISNINLLSQSCVRFLVDRKVHSEWVPTDILMTARFINTAKTAQSNKMPSPTKESVGMFRK